MGRNVNDIIAALPADRRARIEKRGQELINEHETLEDIRKSLGLTQDDLASELNINQQNVSKLEKRSDLKLSTLRGYIESMGGELDIIASFPDRQPVSLNRIGQGQE